VDEFTEYQAMQSLMAQHFSFVQEFGISGMETLDVGALT
jgi:hypothetical protein